MQESIVRRVDHLLVRVQDPEPLFSAFTQQLLLPQAWPVRTTPAFTSGGISLGNLNLEIMQIGRQRQAARLYGIAFQLQPYETSLPALSARDVPHTPPLPFYLVDDLGWQVTAWTNVFLGGLLGGSRLAQLFFNLSQRVAQETWEQGTLPKPFNRRLGLPFILDRIYPEGAVYSVDYNPGWYAANVHAEPNYAGLEVQRVYEVTVGARHYDSAYTCWKALLEPNKEVAPAVWELPGGLHLRLIQRGSDGLRRMIWQVASLNRAVQFLHKREMLGKEKDGMPTIDPQKVQGLDIRLVQ